MLKASRLAAFSAAVLAIMFGPAYAVNDINALWSYEEGAPNEFFWRPADLANSAVGPSALAGSGAQANIATMMGVHTHAGSDWTTPVGNGSGNSYSATNWGVNDYFQIQTSTTGASDIGLQFDQVSSNTGPRDFKVQYSTDGSIFSDFANYMVQPNSTPGWSSVGAVAPAGLDTYNFDLRTITALNNAASVYLRLTLTSTANAANPSSTFAAGGTDRIDNITVYSAYDPAQAPVPQPVTPVLPATGNIAFGLNSPRAKTTLELLQGSAVMSGGSKTAPYSPWTNTPSIQSVKFDNLGAAHNVHGNLLGVDTGPNATFGGSIYSFATQGSVPTPAGQLIGNTTGTGESAVATTRLAGLSVSPSNTKVAVTGLDTGSVIVYDYTPGNTMGSGASLANGRQTTAGTLANTGQGTAWLNDSTALAFSTTGNLFEVDATSMATTLKATVTTGTFTTQSTALAYNPSVSQYVYAAYGGFTAATTVPPAPAAGQSWLFIFDPTNSYSVVNTVDLGGVSVNSVRDLALDAAGNLFIGRSAASITVIVGAAANAATLTANPDVAWYQSDVFGSSFNGLDIGFAPPAAVPGDYNGDTKVNAADYVLWRNDPNAFGGDPAGYNTWRANFGTGGPGSGLGGSAAVPEPASAVLLLFGVVALGCRRRAG